MIASGPTGLFSGRSGRSHDLCYIIRFCSRRVPRPIVQSASPNPSRSAPLDRVAIGISGLCLVQCLLLPVLVMATPLATLGVLDHGAFHTMLLWVIVPSSVAAFVIGYRAHRSRRLLVLGLAALVVLGLVELVGHQWLGHLGSTALVCLGGALLIAAHLVNLRSSPRRLTAAEA